MYYRQRESEQSVSTSARLSLTSFDSGLSLQEHDFGRVDVLRAGPRRGVRPICVLLCSGACGTLLLRPKQQNALHPRPAWVQRAETYSRGGLVVWYSQAVLGCGLWNL